MPGSDAKSKKKTALWSLKFLFASCGFGLATLITTEVAALYIFGTMIDSPYGDWIALGSAISAAPFVWLRLK
jgi:hypothetical protein